MISSFLLRSALHSLSLGVLFLSPLHAQERWEDDLKRYLDVVELSAPSGYKTHAAPVAGSAATGEIAAPAKIEVIACVESNGTRFYVTEESYQRWIETQAGLVWVSCGGTEILPPMPRLVSREPGIDPNSGEDALIELYEDDYAVLPETRWPSPAIDGSVHAFSAAVLSSKPGPGGRWLVDLQLFPNGDANLSPYPFTGPSFREIGNGAAYNIQRLISRPDRASVRLEIDLAKGQPTTPPMEIIAPGMVFLAAFADGVLVRLSVGGDAWSEGAPVSRLSTPVFKRDEVLHFGFLATKITGETTTSITVIPDLVAGADYTKYSLIEAMGAPFDDFNTGDFHTMWTLHFESDLTTRLLAPLYDGRGAPGMLELEGLDLDPVAMDTGATVYTAEQLAALAELIPAAIESGNLPGGWNSIMQSKLGKIPASQRGPETEETGFEN